MKNHPRALSRSVHTADSASSALPVIQASSDTGNRPAKSSAPTRNRTAPSREMRGTGGFGYDVLFVADEHELAGPDGRGLTSAELDRDAKDAISHRGRALRALGPRIGLALGAT